MLDLGFAMACFALTLWLVIFFSRGANGIRRGFQGAFALAMLAWAWVWAADLAWMLRDGWDLSSYLWWRPKVARALMLLSYLWLIWSLRWRAP